MKEQERKETHPGFRGTATVYEELTAILEGSCVNFSIHTNEPSRTVADAKARLLFPVERIVKTIAFRSRSGVVILAALRGTGRVDYARLAAILGLNRRDLTALSPEEVHEELGVEPGSVSPLLLRESLLLILDRKMAGSETLFCGIGRPDRTLEIAFADLVQLTGGQVADLSREG